MDPKNTDPIVIKLFAVVVIFVCVIIGLFGACSSGSSSGSSTPSKSYQTVQDQVIKSDQKWHDNRAKGNW